jgi:prepilin-type N-terminal cleavage/methylation domain-containing protein
MKPRRGLSITELLVVMTVGSVVLTMSAALIHQLMHNESQSRRFYNVERNALRLSAQFRRDVHACGAATIVDEARDDGVFLRLTLADGQTLEYSRRGGALSRIQRDGDNTVSRDEFTFPDGIQLSLREVQSPRRLVLSITADPPTASEAKKQRPWNQYATRVSFQVEAGLGRDLRFAANRAAN